MTEEILKDENNIIFENKLINNKSILKKRLSEIPKSSGCYLFKAVSYTHLTLPTIE